MTSFTLEYSENNRFFRRISNYNLECESIGAIKTIYLKAV